MSPTSIPSLYNQSFQSDEEFTANFVARRPLLDTLCRRLKTNGKEHDGQHQILIGTRGMGKTSLLRRLAIEINHNSELSAYFIPLVFREEQYNVLHLRDFWQNCGEALAEWAETHGHNELATRLDETLYSTAWADDEKAADQFLAEMSALGKRAVLMVDNLDLILDALKDKDHWTLRGHLQSRSGPILIGASTQALSQTADREAAFYEFFQPSYLEPLNLPETERCMRALAQGRAELGKRVVSILNSEPARLKVLHRLSGGNPRVLALTYRFLETTDTKDAMGDLERLLDEVTPYYKARIEEYQTPLQRATIDAIALHWDPVTTGQLAELTGVPSTTLSPQLSRLRKDGVIETVETSGSYSGHQITERFLNIWYLMRHGTRRNKQRMRWLVAFLSSFYSNKELTAIDQEAKATGIVKYWPKDYAEAFAQAQQRTKSDLSADINSSIEESVTIGPLKEESTLQDRQFETLFFKGVSIAQSGDAESAIATFNELLTKFRDNNEADIIRTVARAMIIKGIILGQSGEAKAAIATFEEVIAGFSNSSEIDLLTSVAIALLNKGVLLSQIDSLEAATTTFDELIARFNNSIDKEIQKAVARAMFHKGKNLLKNNNFPDAITTYNLLVTHFGESKEVTLQELVAFGMLNKAIAEGQSGDIVAEVNTYNTLIEKFYDSNESALEQTVAEALLYKGVALEQNGDAITAINSFDLIINRFSASTQIALQEIVAKAMLIRARTLGQSGDLSAEVTACDAIISSFSNKNETIFKIVTAEAIITKGIAFGQSGNLNEAISSFDKLITRFVSCNETELQELVVNAMLNKAITLGLTGESELAIIAFDDLITRYKNKNEIEFQELVANAMLNKAISQGLTGDTEGEVATNDLLIACFNKSKETELLTLVARAMLNKGITLDRSGDTPAAIKLFDTIITRFADHNETPLQEVIAETMLSKGITLAENNNKEEATATFDMLITRFERNTETSLVEQVAKAMLNKAISLGLNGDTVGEITTYDELYKRFAESSESVLLELIARAMTYKGITLANIGELRNEVTSYEQALALLEELETESANQLKTEIAIRLAKRLFDNNLDTKRAEELFLQTTEQHAQWAYTNLFWLYITSERSKVAMQTLCNVDGLPEVGMALINSAIALDVENFGEAMKHLHAALSGNLASESFDFTDDMERLIKLAITRGYGDRLIIWFEETRFSERYAPIYVALKAAMMGEKILLDYNPEVRDSASVIYSRIVGVRTDLK